MNVCAMQQENIFTSTFMPTVLDDKLYGERLWDCDTRGGEKDIA